MRLEPVTRTPAGPVRRALLGQVWTRLTYLHWPYDPAVVRPLLPAGVEPDVHSGSTWVGLISFHMRTAAVAGIPPLPHVASMCETNVRLYSVGPDGRRGVVFRSLDANRLLPVLVGRTYRLPYMWSAMELGQRGDELTYTCQRRWPGPRGVRSRSRVRVGERVAPSGLDDFLTARWRLHSSWLGRTAATPVAHEPWPLHHAELLELDDELVEAAGLPAPQGPPLVLYSPGVDVRIGPPRWVRQAG